MWSKIGGKMNKKIGDRALKHGGCDSKTAMDTIVD